MQEKRKYWMGCYSGILGTLTDNAAFRLALNLCLSWELVGFSFFSSFTVHY